MSTCVVIASRRIDPLLEAEFASGFWEREASVFQTMQCNLALRMRPCGGKAMDFVSVTQLYLPDFPEEGEDCISAAITEVMEKAKSFRKEQAGDGRDGTEVESEDW